MSRFQLLLLSICLVTVSVGCRNRCANVYGGNGLYGGNAFAGGATTIAPPPTYSLNIPSIARNQPYYTPGQTAPTNNTLNPNQRAPTPAIRQATQTNQINQTNQTNQTGWRSVDRDLSGNNGNSGTNGVAPLNSNNPNNGRSVLNSPTNFVQSTPNVNSGSSTRTASATNVNSGSGSGTRTASTAPLPGSGASFTSSTNYQTTRVDETRDTTRIPLNDASAVRAPARNFPTGTPLTTAPTNGYPYQTGQTGIQTGVQTGIGALPFQQPQQTQQTFAGQAGFQQQVPTGYAASPVLLTRQQVPTGYQGQALITNSPYQYPSASAPTVLAQSTATTTPGAASQLGWRDRDLTGRTNRF